MLRRLIAVRLSFLLILSAVSVPSVLATTSSVSAQRGGGAQRAGERGFLSRHFGMSGETRGTLQRARSLTKNGSYSAARRELNQARPAGFRERVALGRTNRNIRRTAESRQRERLRQRIDVMHHEVREGRLSSATGLLLSTQAPARANGRLVRRAESQLRSRILSQTRQRSQAGDAVGTLDALQAMDQFRTSGRLGWFGRRGANRAERQAFSRTLSAAGRNARELTRRGPHGEQPPQRMQREQNAINQTGENLSLALMMSGDGRPSRLGRNRASQTRRASRAVYDRMLRGAERAAGEGNLESTMQALNFAGNIAPASGRTEHFERRAQRILRDAGHNRLGALVRNARQAVRARQHDAAATIMIEVQQLEAQLAILPASRGLRRQRQRLIDQLGPRMDEIAAGHRPPVHLDAPGGAFQFGDSAPPQHQQGHSAQEHAIELRTGGFHQ